MGATMSTKFNIGYARVSTDEQNINNQVDVLKKLEKDGVRLIRDEHIFIDDAISGMVTPTKRPGYKMLKQMVDSGLIDTMYVTELSRIGRNTKESLMETLDIENKGVRVYFLAPSHKSINEVPDIYRPTLMAAMSLAADIERQQISERTKAGLRLVRIKGSKSGKPIGRPVTEIDWKKVDEFKAKGISQRAICRFLGFSEVTFYRKLKERDMQANSPERARDLAKSPQ
jgi:DNA invertase Pin-like site-specific DNA recombinase